MVEVNKEYANRKAGFKVYLLYYFKHLILFYILH